MADYTYRTPQLLLLNRPSGEACRIAAQYVRKLGGRVVSQHGEVAIEARLTAAQGDAVDDSGLFSVRLTGPMSEEGLARLNEQQHLYVRQWNSRFRDEYREMKKRPPIRGVSWGAGDGLVPPLPYTPIERVDFDKIIQRYEESTGTTVLDKERYDTKRRKPLSPEEFVEYEKRLRERYGDETLAYTLSRMGYRFGAAYLELFESLSEDVVDAVLTDPGFPDTGPELHGRVAVGIVFVESSLDGGPTFSTSERNDICDQIIDGLNWLADQHPTNDLTFVFNIQFVSIAVQEEPDDPQDERKPEEAYWRNAALGEISLGGNTYAPTWDSVAEFRADLRSRYAADHGVALFATPYNTWHYAYAGGGRITLTDKDDWGGWGRSVVDCVTAHEMCHIFGAADEYVGTVAACSNCGSAHGRDRIANGNCAECARPHQTCLMDDNKLRLCAYTKGQLGWSTLFVELITADVKYAGTDDTVEIDIGDRVFELGTSGHDDRERDHREGYAVYEPGLQFDDIKRVLIRKSSDGDYGGWRLGRVKVQFQGAVICDEAVDEWIEDDHLFWNGCIRDSSLVNQLTVRVTTADVNNAGTDDKVTLRLAGRTWTLDNQGHDDFERGNTDTFELDPQTGFYVNDINTIRIEKASDGSYGGWRLGGIELVVNGTTVFNNQSIDRWLEDDDRTWTDTVNP